MINITVEKKFPDARLPEYAHANDSGADVFAYIKGMPQAINTGEKAPYLVLHSGDTLLVSTGIICELPDTHELQVRSKSGLASKESLHVLNSPGTIDAGYRGEIGVILHNAGQLAVVIDHGQKIAQLVVAPVLRANFIQGYVDEVSTRGKGGFGSTGR